MDEVYDIVKFKNENGDVDEYPIEERRNKSGQTWDSFEEMLKVCISLVISL